MNKSSWTKARTNTVNEKGQITIFIVLVFQVLFVFFAMVTNIGLVVHEKINLQNATDLAAMYGAQKQAEVLNAIGHLNYQIRQDWKILAFRVRALGDMGRIGHPLAKTLELTNAGLYSDDPWPPVANFNPGGGNASGIFPPMVCITHSAWSIQGWNSSNTNICQSENGIPGVVVPQLPQVNIILPFIDDLVKNKFDNLQNQIEGTCKGAGYVNWKYAATFLVSYKFALRKKLQKIKRLKEKLERGLDIEGNPIADGVRKTLMANLTSASTPTPIIEWINSMADGSLPFEYTTNWLRPVRVWPAVFFINFPTDPGCTGESKNLLDIALANNGGALGGWNPSYGFAPGHPLFEYTKEPSPTTDPWDVDGSGIIATSVGVEKNPWVLVYSGVKVQSQAVKPFFPFGNGHNLVAQAYAQPFGSTVGPWANSQWAQGAISSGGGSRVDALLPEQWVTDPSSPGSIPAFQNQNIPNFSRFPGDQLGLTSRLALSEVSKWWIQNNGVIKTEHYMDQPFKAYDQGWSLANGLAGKLELFASSPNEFDMAYYNIDPMAVRIFNQREISGQVSGVNLGTVTYDYMDTPTKIEGIKAQILNTNNFGITFKRVKDWKHLLTGWTATNPSVYEPTTTRFGNCIKEVPDGGSPTSGNCIAGGRAGYSVKLVSEDFLKSAMELGNTGTGGGQILNPPTAGP